MLRVSYVFFALMLLLLSVGCGEDEDDCLNSEMTLEEYRIANSIQATEGTGGLFYVILEPGEALRPSPTSQVVVTYRGYTTEDETFDETPSNTTRTFQLNSLIAGWQQGIPLVGTGGKIQLFVPSALAYGPNQAGNICPNTDLIFDIELVGFNDQ
ncbi:hypothetical protein LEM8419_00919 [Neolewinella maritima]|uniref:Peptidyl-prolyl cis-trans isomerase n=1 Tax=Neolewinella maritima TaxID=1383882 RepID=A0ABN8F030_9BACT|nr:FKBP-type peptidyl-prolyl cis-trans isomerase [Neolewinella maritima]CAH0999619.1 hypothetical protein LEM8419_00919 [Neolewinella maritima]